MRNSAIEKRLTADNALDRLMYMGLNELYMQCKDACLKLYGRHFINLQKYDRLQLVNWWVCHFRFDESFQLWIDKQETI